MVPIVLVSLLVLNGRSVQGAWTNGNSVEVSWTHWVSLILSRGVYFVLAVLILLCVLYTVLKDKFGPNKRDLEISFDPANWLDTLWKAAGCEKVSGYNPCFRNYAFRGMLGKIALRESDVPSETELFLQERLKSAESEVNVLRDELDHSHRSRVELTNSLEELDKDKMTIEEKLELEKVNGIMEIEELKKENLSTQRELQRIMDEKQELGREVESLQREARIAESALRDQQQLQARLEEARMEVQALRNQMASLQAEKQMAVNLVSDMVSKASKRATPHHLDAALPSSLSYERDGLMQMLDQGGDTHNIDLEDDEFAVQNVNYSTESNEEEINTISQGDVGDGGTVRRRRPQSVHDDDFDDSDEESRMVTGSPAFREFLQNSMNSSL